MAHRLDAALVARGHFATRSRARDAILRGTVRINGEIARKAGLTISESDLIEVDDPAQGYVSRAALKLVAGLKHFGFAPADRIALDIGASTGGFCQVLLEHGARHVYALDVGHDQLAPSLSANARLSNLQGVNARALTKAHLSHGMPTALVSDVSFISLRLALPPALALAQTGAWGIFLVKPQFEVGKDHIGKGGLVRDDDLAQETADAIADWLDEREGWRVAGLVPSPIAGGDGNREFLLGARKIDG